MATKMAFLCFSFFFFATVPFITDAFPIVSDLEAFPSSDLGLLQSRDEKDFCPYSVIITTSCHSPTSTGDHISLVFGDNIGNQVYVPRLDFAAKPSEGLFEKCSSDTFQVKGPCASQICFAYLYRTGPYGWVPETIEIYAEASKAVKFDFNETTIPENKWYGHNLCNDSGSTPPHFPPYSPSVPPPPPEFLPPPPPPPVRPSATSERRASKLVVLGSFAAAVVLGAAVVV